MTQKIRSSLCALGCVAFAFAFGYFLARHPAQGNKDWLDYLTAVGTFGAAVVALFLGLWQQSQARIQDKARARVVASKVLTRLVWSIEESQSAQAMMKGWNEYDELSHRNSLDEIWDHVKAAKWTAPTDDLLGLIPLDTAIADNIAHGYLFIELVDQEIHGRVNRSPFEPFDPDSASQLIELWCGQINTAIGSLEKARDVCNKYSDTRIFWSRANSAKSIW